MKFLFYLFIFLTFNSFSQQSSIFPQPNFIETKDGYFEFNGKLSVQHFPKIFQASFDYLKDRFQMVYGIQLTENESQADIICKFDDDYGQESYSLKIDSKGIEVGYGDLSSIMFAFESLAKWQKEAKKAQFVQIVDQPRFSYRGMHLDCSRHFFTIEEIKVMLDQMFALKLNTFHWHLTDDQGWRIEIKKFPKLTEIGAWRDSTVIGHGGKEHLTYNNIKHGGFYSQNEVKSLVQYAQNLGITIIPEIEMPGHARAALAAYPQYSCTGIPYPVASTWGVFNEVFCPSKETIQFLCDILDEVITLFPSKIIHIGGDECPKVSWLESKECAFICLENNIKNGEELQSYFIKQIEKHLNSRGKTLMGWDEILEGGLADGAMVMSWRGEDGGIAAAKQGHQVVMTPGSHCYFDHYQGKNQNEPLAIGGYTSLEKVYSYEPLPQQLTEEEKRFVLGAQGNLWTEYMSSIEQVQYMAFPRLIALSQVLWTYNKPVFSDFLSSMVKNELPRLKKQYVTYAKSFLDPEIIFESAENGLVLSLKSAFGEVNFENATNKVQVLRTDVLTESTLYYQVNFENNQTDYSRRVFAHGGLGYTASFSKAPGSSYSQNGSLGLNDGILGDKGLVRGWLGFTGHNLQISYDFGKAIYIDSLLTNLLCQEKSWIYLPERLKIEKSKNGKRFKTIQKQNLSEEKVKLLLDTKTRYLRISFEGMDKIPVGKTGEGYAPWLFIDEIIFTSSK